jgi:phospholipid-translocating ATPase
MVTGISPFAEPDPGEGTTISNPVKRIRWATQRVTGKSGAAKRKSIFNRHLNRSHSTKEDKRESGVSDPYSAAPDEESAESEEQGGRTIYFNQPLPPEAKDEDGRPRQHYTRNKIRTAKYTPISFVPKNLWLQFHNVANVYFLFIIILSVCAHLLDQVESDR